jgi:hypothetical protein
VSPYTLIWNGDFYYLVGWNHEQQETRTYRVDRILQKPDILEENARPVPQDFDIARYTREVFRMFDNEEPKTVTLLCHNEVMKGVIDIFGMDIRVRKADADHFRTKVTACTSPTFYSWVFQWGGKIRIEGEKLFISGKDGKWAEVPLENNNVYHGQRYWGSGHSVLIEDYYYCLRSGEKFEIDALEGGRAAQIVTCCYVSSESGESVTTD